MTELIYYVASTLDGFIAHSDGTFDGFAWDDEVVADFVADQAQFGAVIMGRKTYEVGLKEGKTNPYPDLQQVVFSTTMQASPDPAVELVKTGLLEKVTAMKADGGDPIWLCGGSDLATQLFQAGLIDRVVVKLNPVVFGEGIPLFGGLVQHHSLLLEKTKQYGCGILVLHYRVMP